MSLVPLRLDPPKAILLSAGGNDIAGEEFAMLLRILHKRPRYRGS